MLLIWSLMFSAVQLRVDRPSPSAPVAIQRCPDGSTIRATEACLPAFDDSHALTHQPARQTRTEQWWCGRSAKSSEIVVVLESAPSLANPRATSEPVARLAKLIVNRMPAPPAILRVVRNKVASAKGLYNISGRCFWARPRGVVSALSLQSSGDGNSEIELR